MEIGPPKSSNEFFYIWNFVIDYTKNYISRNEDMNEEQINKVFGKSK